MRRHATQRARGVCPVSCPASCAARPVLPEVSMSDRKLTLATLVRVAVLCCAGSGMHAAYADPPLPNNDGNDGVLRVCADPNNMPLSNNKGEGYENQIASQM